MHWWRSLACLVFCSNTYCKPEAERYNFIRKSYCNFFLARFAWTFNFTFEKQKYGLNKNAVPINVLAYYQKAVHFSKERKYIKCEHDTTFCDSTSVVVSKNHPCTTFEYRDTGTGFSDEFSHWCLTSNFFTISTPTQYLKYW